MESTRSESELLQQADKLFNSEKYEEAAKLYKEALAYGDNVLILVSLGKCYYFIKDYLQAQTSLEYAEKLQAKVKKQDKLDKLQLNLYFLLGKVYWEGFKDHDKAKSALEESLKHTHNDKIIHQDIQTLLNEIVESGSSLSTAMETSQSTDLLSQVDQRRLNEARDVAGLLQDMEKQVTDGSKWYIVNMKWIDAWQKYTYFDLLSEDDSKDDQITEDQRVHPGQVKNQDIVLDISSKVLLTDVSKTKQWQNILLKPNLKEGEDYMIVDEKIWCYWSNRYKQDLEIIRYGILVNEDTQEAIVEIYLKSILVFPIPNKDLFKFTAPRTVVLSRKETILGLEKKLQSVLNYYLYTEMKNRSTLINKMRLWKSLTNNIEEIEQLDKKFKNYTSVKVDALPLNINQRLQLQQIEECNIADDDIIIIEILLQHGAQWKFQPQSVQSPEESKVFQPVEDDNRQFVPLEEIQRRDLNEVLTSSSKRGVTGLQNLGNTCFMNSGLQCLSNTIELTKYFCFNYHRIDINKDNPLGMGGRLAMAYAELMHDMWIGGSGRCAPWEVKKVIGKRVTKFSGFGQQDSCELVNFMLDLLHEDLNRVIKKPYVEQKDSAGRPDEEVSDEYWEGFLARNKSIIVDLMYGQLKSTVVCQTCFNVSITFDPFLTLSLPIARPFKVNVFYVPYDVFEQTGNTITQKQVKIFTIALNKDSKIKDLAEKVAELVNENVDPQKLIVANVDIRSRIIETKFKVDQSCQDIEQHREETMVYEMRPPSQEDDIKQYKSVELCFMTLTNYGRVQSGEALMKVLPRLEYYHQGLTIIDIKRSIFNKVKYIFDESKHEASDQDLNKMVVLHVVDNLPMIRENGYSRKALCEFCEQRHGQADTCDLKIKAVSANSEQGCTSLTLADVFEHMKHKRDLVLGVIFLKGQGASTKKLEPVYDTSHAMDAKHKSKENISLDSCFQAFSREELLSGADQWYCSKCKEQKDILKKLELFKVPKVLIIQLKRFQSKRSNSGQGGFFNLAYAQVMSQEKVGDLVDFPIESLDIRPYLQGKDKEGEPIYYDLYAVSNHYGSLHGGHYTAYGYNALMKKWYDFNDSSVSSVSNINQIVSPGAYLLFYRRRD